MNIDLTVLCDVVSDPRRQQYVYQTHDLVMIVTLSQQCYEHKTNMFQFQNKHVPNYKQTCSKL